MTDVDYDPATVDWPGLIRTVKDICGREARFCAFAVRAFFHDSGSFTGPGDGSDASILLNDLETLLVRPILDCVSFVVASRDISSSDSGTFPCRLQPHGSANRTPDPRG